MKIKANFFYESIEKFIKQYEDKDEEDLIKAGVDIRLLNFLKVAIDEEIVLNFFLKESFYKIFSEKINTQSFNIDFTADMIYIDINFNYVNNYNLEIENRLYREAVDNFNYLIKITFSNDMQKYFKQVAVFFDEDKFGFNVGLYSPALYEMFKFDLEKYLATLLQKSKEILEYCHYANIHLNSNLYPRTMTKILKKLFDKSILDISDFIKPTKNMDMFVRIVKSTIKNIQFVLQDAQ